MEQTIAASVAAVTHDITQQAFTSPQSAAGTVHSIHCEEGTILTHLPEGWDIVRSPSMNKTHPRLRSQESMCTVLHGNNTPGNVQSLHTDAQDQDTIPSVRDGEDQTPFVPLSDSPPLVEEPAPPLKFYDWDKPYFQFTNFSFHPIAYEGRLYPTSEHLFQAFKFLYSYPDLAERVRSCSTSREALSMATSVRQCQRPDWFAVNIRIMEEVLLLKFTQYPELRTLLKERGDQELVEDSPIDGFWGVGSDGRGRNELGKALMRVRSKLQNI